MAENNNGISFLQGMMFGVLVGATAGVLLAPKSGEETRADIAAAARRLQERADTMYSDARAMVERKVAALKEAGSKIDTKKYSQLVDNVVSEMKDTKKMTKEEAVALGNQLKADSSKFVEAAKA